MEITCTVERIIFTDRSTGYAVISCVSEKDERVVMTGQLAEVKPSERITVTGDWTEHYKYGRQFKADRYARVSAYDHTKLFERLSRSSFRRRFCLKDKDREYIREKTLPVIERHAAEMIASRLAPAYIGNDGKQTPMKGHPVFIAQHATATCCRGCLEKWHGIPAGRELTDAEQAYVKDVIMTWIKTYERIQQGE